MASANYNLPLDTGWKFHLGDFPRKTDLTASGYHHSAQAGGDLLHVLFDENWTDIAVPHDWLIALPYDQTAAAMSGYKRRGVAWYKNEFILPETPVENATLVFDGVLGQCTVYVNGIIAVRNFSGYNRFEAEIGDYLLPGKTNVIHLFVDASRWEAWWYEGAGLYRPCRIEFRDENRFYARDCFVRTGDSEVLCNLRLLAETGATVRAELLEEDGKMVFQTETDAKGHLSLSLPCPSPKLWSPDSPNLYTVRFSLIAKNTVVDAFSVQVGFRTTEWITNKGFYLNGKRYPVKGICCHQDHAGVGAAVTPEINEFRLLKLKKLGINAYRCAHHAVTEDFLALCDKIGILVMAENRHFSVSPDAQNQLESMVKVSRNHPSVFLYSLFNEEPWQEDFRGRRMAKKMRDIVRRLDDTRAVCAAQNSGILEKENASDALDIIGVNYALADFPACHKRSPEKVLLGTENCPTFATRGEYVSDKSLPVFTSFGDEWADWFAENLPQTMDVAFGEDYVAGCFVWCGFEHRGEPVPHAWPCVTSHWGIHDLCGYEKDTAYWLAAYYRDDLVCHLLPHWNHDNGKPVRVATFTNGDSAELFVNGVSQGIKEVQNRRAEWMVDFVAGELQVTATRGNQTATDTVQTAGSPFALLAEDVTPQVKNPASHIVNVSVVDQNGTVVPHVFDTVKCSADNGRILGVGNGNPNGHFPEQAREVPLFHSKAQIIVEGSAKALTLTCGNLPPATITFHKE